MFQQLMYVCTRMLLSNEGRTATLCPALIKSAADANTCLRRRETTGASGISSIAGGSGDIGTGEADGVSASGQLIIRDSSCKDTSLQSIAILHLDMTHKYYFYTYVNYL
jgi:hypothetical protein